MEKKSAAIADDTQKSQTALIEAVLETIQGMSMVKSFNLTGKGDRKLRDALEYNRQSNIEVTNILTPYTALQEAVLQIAGVGMMLAAVLLWAKDAMSLANALMVFVLSFSVFNQIKAFGMGVSMLRLAAAAIDRTVQTEDMPRMDEAGKALKPEKHDIVFEHVSFSYEKKPVLRDISVTLPDRTTTAVIGPSGSGKTTFCNLIARFWDADSGSVKIGGCDVKAYTLEALMEQIGEGGANLSSGEKQRISIARAMLKNAPIVILDGATANVDPENEDRLQKAIEALTRNKTIIMIAHRLKTVRHADQILVIDHGEIVQRGRHEQLIAEPGIYQDFVGGKKQAVAWKR